MLENKQNISYLDFITTLNFRASQHPNFRNRKAIAFTLAEILISLTIIGIIAAITLPALQSNINEKTWATKRKALYSRMSQAIAIMPSLNGYGVVFNEQGGIDEAQTAQRATQAFLTDGLSKVLKINNICPISSTDASQARKELAKCGFPEKFTKHGKGAPKMDTPTILTELNEKFSCSSTNIEYYQIDTKTAAFETVNGESILVFYNPSCSYVYGLNRKHNNANLMQPTMCANFLYDLNGLKGPNKVGKDIGFMTVFYPSDSEIVAPAPVKAIQVFKSTYPVYSVGIANAECRKKFGDDTRIANINELESLFVNTKLGNQYTAPGGILPGDMVYSANLYGNDKFYVLTGDKGNITTNISYPINAYNWVYCLKK